MTILRNKRFRKEKRRDFITIVAGLPRSGTSMMMCMLEAGGVDSLTDHIRKPDRDNPKGYYEFERVKKIKEDTSWLDKCWGKAVKMVSELLYYLPSDKDYKVIFMRRNIDEILSSQKAMLERLGRKGANKTDSQMIALFGRHLEKTNKWLSKQDNIEVLYINYNDVLRNPRLNTEKIDHFFENRLNVDKMCGVVDNSLYRQRKPR